MTLESPTATVQKPASYLFGALTQVANYEKLMPENIVKFEVIGDDAFLFGLKGMPEIQLRMKEKTPNNKVVLGAASDKLSFSLSANIREIDASASSVQLLFEGEFNAMMAMMIKGPISKFIETLAQNMDKL